MFVKLEGDKLGESDTKTTWEGRLAMVASNRDADEGEQEAFVVSKYDLVPESLVDMVQVSWVRRFNLAGEAGSMLSVVWHDACLQAFCVNGVGERT